MLLMLPSEKRQSVAEVRGTKSTSSPRFPKLERTRPTGPAGWLRLWLRSESSVHIETVQRTEETCRILWPPWSAVSAQGSRHAVLWSPLWFSAVAWRHARYAIYGGLAMNQIAKTKSEGSPSTRKIVQIFAVRTLSGPNRADESLSDSSRFNWQSYSYKRAEELEEGEWGGKNGEG